MKQLKDYLHLYLGCEVAVNYNLNEVGGMMIDKVTGVYDDGSASISNGYLEPISKLKPILRPLSDLRFEEKQEQAKLFNEAINTDALPEAVGIAYMLSKHFDLFGLIESGLAIDKTKLNSDLLVKECDARKVDSSNKAGSMNTKR